LDAERKSESSFEEVKRRAEAKLRGITEEQIEFSDIGMHG